MAAGHNFLYFLFIVASVTVTTNAYPNKPAPVIKGGYYPSWLSKFPPSSINTSLFTHIYYAFLSPNNVTYKFEISNSTAIALFNLTSTLHYQNPPMKVLFSIGGGDSNTNMFARIASTTSSRSVFINSAIDVARRFEFDGMDLDWEFPQSPKEMWNLGQLLQEWRHAINKEAQLTGQPPLLLTAAVYFSSHFLLARDNRSYPIDSVKNNLDWINVMCYDYHGAWSNITGPNAALFDPNSRINSIYGLNSWIEAGVPREKIVMGLPLYGRTWKLKDPKKNGIGAIAVGPGPGQGTLFYSQIEKFNKEQNATVVHDATTVSVYSFVGSSWIAYDNALTITTKIGFAQALELRGYFFWALGYDKEWTISTQASKSWIRDNDKLKVVDSR